MEPDDFEQVVADFHKPSYIDGNFYCYKWDTQLYVKFEKVMERDFINLDEFFDVNFVNKNSIYIPKNSGVCIAGSYPLWCLLNAIDKKTDWRYDDIDVFVQQHNIANIKTCVMYMYGKCINVIKMEDDIFTIVNNFDISCCKVMMTTNTLCISKDAIYAIQTGVNIHGFAKPCVIMSGENVIDVNYEQMSHINRILKNPYKPIDFTTENYSHVFDIFKNVHVVDTAVYNNGVRWKLKSPRDAERFLNILGVNVNVIVFTDNIKQICSIITNKYYKKVISPQEGLIIKNKIISDVRGLMYWGFVNEQIIRVILKMEQMNISRMFRSNKKRHYNDLKSVKLHIRAHERNRKYTQRGFTFVKANLINTPHCDF